MNIENNIGNIQEEKTNQDLSNWNFDVSNLSSEELVEKYIEITSSQGRELNTVLKVDNFKKWIGENTESINSMSDKLISEFERFKLELIEKEDVLTDDLPSFEDVVVDMFEPGIQKVSFSEGFNGSPQLNVLKESLESQLRDLSITIPDSEGSGIRSQFGLEVRGRKITEMISLLKGKDTFFKKEDLDLYEKFDLLKKTYESIKAESIEK